MSQDFLECADKLVQTYRYTSFTTSYLRILSLISVRALPFFITFIGAFNLLGFLK